MAGPGLGRSTQRVRQLRVRSCPKELAEPATYELKWRHVERRLEHPSVEAASDCARQESPRTVELTASGGGASASFAMVVRTMRQ